MSSSDDEEVPLAVPLAAAAAAAPATGGSEPVHATQETGAAAAAEGEAAAAQPPTSVQPVPVTLITGFLGAGKTTLVNHILTAKHGYRCAVLLNEIADSADIERALVKEPEGQDASPLAQWTELENGCICCSAKNDMVKALESLMQQRDRFDYVLIETTGLANPGPVAAALWTDEQLESSICLDCIVTVVDARHVRRQLADRRADGGVNEAQQQVAFADVVLLNKTDLADEQQLREIEGEIRGVNAEASITRCQRCSIDLRLILNTGMYSAGLRGAAAAAGNGGESGGAVGAEGGAVAADGGSEQQQTQQQQQQQAGGEEHACGPQCSNPEHHHHHHHHGSDSDPNKVGTVTITLPAGQPLDLARLRHWLDTLLWEDGAAGAAGAAGTADAADIFRIKGLLCVAGSSHKHVLQGVHEIYDVVEGPEWRPGEPRGSKLVFIGRRLRRDALAVGLQACLVPSDS